MIKRPLILAIPILVFVLSGGTSAAAPREDIPPSYRRVAAKYKLAPTLLYATALTASGRLSPPDQEVRPWPWTLTLDGRRSHYATREAAYAALADHLLQGRLEVRVGLMGLPWCRYALQTRSSWALLDPDVNLRLAAARLAPYLTPGFIAGRSRPQAAWINQLIARLAPRYALDPQLVRTVVATESSFNPRARSRKGAKGVMQLMPATATRFEVRDVGDPEQNLTGGMRYLAWLLGYYRGDLTRVLAAYNAGEKAVDRYGGVPPYPETRAYVARILARYGRRTHPYRERLALALRTGDRA